MEKIIEFLKTTPYFTYTTVSEEGKPESRPFGFYMLHEGKLYVGMGSSKNCCKQTIKNPAVCLTALNDKREWIRIRATAVADTSEAALLAACESSPRMKKRFETDPEGMRTDWALFYLKDGEAEFHTAEGGRITF